MKFNRRLAGGAQKYVRLGPNGHKHECVVWLDHKLGCPHRHLGDPEADDCGCGSLAELRERDAQRTQGFSDFRRQLGQFLRR
jgi:hypothetical protein